MQIQSVILPCCVQMYQGHITEAGRAAVDICFKLKEGDWITAAREKTKECYWQETWKPKKVLLSFTIRKRCLSYFF